MISKIRITVAESESLRAVAASTDGWALEDGQTLRNLRRGFDSWPVLSELGQDIRHTLAAHDIIVLSETPVDCGAAIVALFQTIAVASGFGNGGQIVHTVAPRRDGEPVDLS